MKRIVQVLIIISAFVYILQLTKPLRAEILLKKGRDYIDNGYPFKAIAEYKKAQTFDPVNGTIFFQKGVAYGKISQKKLSQNSKIKYVSSVIENFGKSIDYKNDTSADYYMARAYEINDKATQAIEIYKKLLVKDSNSKNAKEAKIRLKNIYRDIGDKFFTEGDEEKAIENYDKAIKLNGLNFTWGTIEDYKRYAKLSPDNLNIYYWLAHTYKRLDYLDSAVKNFEKLRSMGMENYYLMCDLSAVYYQLGKKHQRENNYQKAIESYMKIIDIDSKNKYGYFERSIYALYESYQHIEDWGKAIVMVKKLEKIDMFKGNALNSIGKIYEKRNMWNEAIKVYEEYLKIRPLSDTAIFVKLGYLYDMIDNESKAIETYMGLEDFDTTRGMGYYHIGKLYEKRQKWSDAIKAYEEYLKFRPLSDVNIFLVLGLLYDTVDNESKAIEAYMRLEDFDTTKGMGYYNIGNLLKKKRKWNEAIEAYKKYLMIYDNRDDVYFELCGLYSETNNLDLAMECYNRAIHKDIGNVKDIKRKSYIALGRVYSIKNDEKKSMEFYKKANFLRLFE